jgi:tetratricopeptide (TPR) repeat protein
VLGALAVIIILGVAIRQRVWFWNIAAVNVPVPTDLEKLDPQLRDYLRLQLNWVRQKPVDPARQATLGIVYAANLLWAEAAGCFSNVTKLNPKESLGHLYLAVAMQETGDYSGALELFRQTTKTFSNFAPGYDRLGTALLRAGHADEAESAFQRLTELAPDEWRGFAGLGEVKLRQNKAAEAAQFLEKAQVIEPKARMIDHLLGLAYRGLGRTEEAEWELRVGLNAVQSPMPDAWGLIALEHVRLLPQQIDLASEYLSENRPTDVLQVLREAVKYHPDDLTVLEYIGQAHRSLNEFEQTRRIAELMLSLNERSVNAHVLMADVCLDLDRKDEAMTHAERAIVLGPDLPRPYLAKADVTFAFGRTTEGLIARQEALKRDPQNPLIAVDVGDALLHLLGKPQEAEKFYQQAIRLNSALPLGYLRLAEAAIGLQQFDRARKAVALARKLDPQAPELVELEAQLSSRKNTDAPR